MRLPLKTIDQKKRAVITRPFGREAGIVTEKPGKNQALSAFESLFFRANPPVFRLPSIYVMGLSAPLRLCAVPPRDEGALFVGAC
jgi:hypothetical protein